MGNVAGYTQMGMPAASGAPVCGRSSLLAWQLTNAAVDAKSTISTFVDTPATHRHRRPWGTS
jgi:hypothetical protein